MGFPIVFSKNLSRNAQYVLAFFCALALPNIVMGIFEEPILVTLQSHVSSAPVIVISYFAIESAITVAAFAVIYSLFQNLKLQNVMPWVCVAIIGGILIDLTLIAMFGAQAQVEVPLVVAAAPVIFGLACIFGIGAVFKATGRWSAAAPF